MKHMHTRFLVTQDFGVSKTTDNIGNQDPRESERDRNNGIETRKSLPIAKHAVVGELARTYPPGSWGNASMIEGGGTSSLQWTKL